MSAYCPFCGQAVEWVNASTAADLLGINESRVRQLVRAGRLPGSVKFDPPGREKAFWKIPLTSVAAYSLARRNT